MKIYSYGRLMLLFKLCFYASVYGRLFKPVARLCEYGSIFRTMVECEKSSASEEIFEAKLCVYGGANLDPRGLVFYSPST